MSRLNPFSVCVITSAMTPVAWISEHTDLQEKFGAIV